MFVDYIEVFHGFFIKASLIWETFLYKIYAVGQVFPISGSSGIFLIKLAFTSNYYYYKERS